MALLAQLPVDDDMSFQRSCLLKKLRSISPMGIFPLGKDFKSVPNTRFPRMTALSGASEAESQGKIESMIQGLFIVVLFLGESDCVAAFFRESASFPGKLTPLEALLPDR
jgi:hypothetical protein